MKKIKPSEIVYKTDASKIEGTVHQVFLPQTIEEIQNIVRSNTNIVPRGAGTGLAGGAVPFNSVVIDISKMDKILNFNTEEKIVEVEAGIILENLNQEIEIYGLEFPVNPSSSKSCTIGGMIATNAIGSRAVKYGRTSDWIKDIEIVDGKGDLIKISKIDVLDIAGKEGTTGIIVKARLKLSPIKKRTASLMKLNTPEKIPEIIRRLKLRGDVSMTELLDKKISKYLGLDEKYHLLVEFESDAGEIKDVEYENITKSRENLYSKLSREGYTRIEDPKIMVFDFPKIIKYLEMHQIPFFSHVGIGIIHLCFRKNENSFADSVLFSIKKMHGDVSGEFGIGIKKKKFLEENDKKLLRAIKSRMDPFNKLNPGKILD